MSPPRHTFVVVRYVSTAAFAVALLGFLLPFGTVGCDGEQVEVTGVELATYRVPGAERDRSGEPNLAQEMEDDGGWVALLALVAAATGLALAAAARGWWGLVSLVGLAAVLVLPFIAAGELADVWIHVGFVLAVVGFSVAGCTRAVDRAQRRRDAGKHWWPYGLAAAPLVLASALVTLGWVAASPPP